MDKNNLEVAYSIIDKSETRAEDLFQKAVNETLPRQLKDIPIEEHLEFYRRKSKELREWYNRIDIYDPFFDLEKYGRDRIAGMIKGSIDAVDKGKKIKWFRDLAYQDTINTFSQRIMTVKYIRYLKGLIDERTTPGKLDWTKSQLRELSSMRQVAILYRYLRKEITVDNMDEIASEYGWTSPTSGKKLYDFYNSLRFPTDRTGKHKYAVRDIEKVLAFLHKHSVNKDAILWAKDELETAKSHNR